MGWTKRAVEKMEAKSPPDCRHPHMTDKEWLIGGVLYAVKQCARCGHSRTVGVVRPKGGR
jgi:hypothetical protein